jgi:SNF2 family DNA or RNA helicase
VSTDLWPHQTYCVNRLAPLGSGALFAEPGAGKTLMALALMADEWRTDTNLVLCPKSVISVWARQPEVHYPGTFHIITPTKGTAKDKAAFIVAQLDLASAIHKNALVALNYEAMIQPALFGVLKSRRWGLLCCDESHRIKAPAGKASRYASQLADRADHRLILTGTPMPHSPLDIYGQFRACDKSVLGTSAALFRAKYAVIARRTTRDGREFEEVVDYRNLRELTDLVDAHSARVRTADCLDLPEHQDIVLYCELPPRARRVYNDLEATLAAELDKGTLTASNALVRGLRLQQVTNGVVPGPEGEEEIHTAKLDVLQDLLADLTPDYAADPEPVVVFCQFHTDLDAVYTAAKGAGRTSLELSGRRNELAAWQAGQADVLAVQIQAGGVGIDLSRARYAVFYSHTWSLGDYEQARARVLRPGQTRHVTYYHIVAENSMDQVVQEALDRKSSVTEAVLGALSTAPRRRARSA